MHEQTHKNVFLVYEPNSAVLHTISFGENHCLVFWIILYFFRFLPISLLTLPISCEYSWTDNQCWLKVLSNSSINIDLFPLPLLTCHCLQLLIFSESQRSQKTALSIYKCLMSSDKHSKCCITTLSKLKKHTKLSMRRSFQYLTGHYNPNCKKGIFNCLQINESL